MRGNQMGDPKQKLNPLPMTREQFDNLTFQDFDPVTLEKIPSAAEIAKQKERKSKHEFRVFLVIGIPAGFVLALFVALSTNMGDKGFFCAWAVFALIIGALFSSMSNSKKSPE
jgi:hypothetical protein